MSKQLHGVLVYNRRVLSEKYISNDKVVLGTKDSTFEVPNLDQFQVYDGKQLYLKPEMKASLSIGGKVYRPNDERKPNSTKNNVEAFDFSENDWLILNIGTGLDFILNFAESAKSVPVTGGALMSLSQALESPVARALLLSFVIHTAFIFYATFTARDVEVLKYKMLESRWIEVVSNVDEHQEDEKEEVPVIEDKDDVIIDDAVKDMERPKIDDSESQIANLDKIEKPVGIQAALGGIKVHDMESLFGSSAGLGDALDYMPETLEGDAYGTGAGFGAGLSGIGMGGGGGGGGYGSGIGGMGRGGGSGTGDSGTKVTGPKKSTVKQKPKLAMDAPKQGAFCKESNIRDVVQKRSNALRNCYEQQLLANPELSGKIIVFWKIGLDGKVTDASIKSSTMSNARVESCLTQTIRRLRFDPPDGGICVVEFPFIFTSAQ